MEGARKPAALAAVVILAASLLSCNDPDSIAKFCSSAVVTLRTGDALFDDMKASCVREAQTREAFDAFAVADPDSAACESVGKQAEGLKAASKVVSDYFKALHDLAAFGTSKAGEDAKDLAAKASTQAKLGAAPQNALSSIAGFLTRAATSGYQQKHLTSDIVAVHEDIKAALEGLGEAAGVAYLQQLREEEKKTATRYKEFLAEHKGAAELTLQLDSRWQGDRARFAAKERAAVTYKAALATMGSANEELAAHARGLRAKDLPGLLSPYTAQLEGLAQTMQKAF
jgi:hypothetical protein